MMQKLVSLGLLLVLFSTACNVTIGTVGEEVTEEINIPAPDTGDTIHFNLDYGIGDLKISPGSDQLVTGTAIYNINELKPKITISGGTVNIRQGESNIRLFNPIGMVNKWELLLGDAPIDMEIDAGAYKAEYDFGGLSITNLSIQDGASDVELDFSAPNLIEMSLLRYETGLSNVSLNPLANANFSNMQFEGGGGNYTLDFSGELKRDASIYIEAGLGSLVIYIPAGIPAEIKLESGLSNVSIPSNWTQDGNVYTQAGSGPTLSFVIQIGAGNLTVRE